jgi:hypothetical protein
VILISIPDPTDTPSVHADRHPPLFVHPPQRVFKRMRI